MLVTNQFIPHFKKRKAGKILVTASLAAIIAFPRDAVYGAAKRAQQGMLKSLYYEMRLYGVQVKAMPPWGTKTNFQTSVNDVEVMKKRPPISANFCWMAMPNFQVPKKRPKSFTERRLPIGILSTTLLIACAQNFIKCAVKLCP